MMKKYIIFLTLNFIFLCQNPVVFAKSAPKKNTIKPIKKITVSANQNFSIKDNNAYSEDSHKIKAEGSFYTGVFLKKDKKNAWGLSLYTKELRLPLTVKWGNLSASGSISKLKNPQFSSTISAFGAKTLGATTIYTTLPSAASSKNLQWIYGNLFFSPNITGKQLNLSLCGFWNENKTSGFSFFANFQPGSRKNLAFSSTIYSTQIFHNDNQWYSFFPYFPSQQMIFQNHQLSFSSPQLSTKINFNIFQNPILLDQLAFTYGIEATYCYSAFMLNLGAFGTSSNQIWTALNNQLKTFRQFKINPQYTTYLFRNQFRLKFGLCLLAEEKLWEKGQTYEDEESLNDYSKDSESQQRNFSKETMFFGETLASAKFQAGTELATKHHYISAGAQATGLVIGTRLQDVFEKGNDIPKGKVFKEAKYLIQMKFGWKDGIKAAFATNYNFDQQHDFTTGILKSSLQWNPFSKKNLCAKINSELTFEDSNLKKTVLESSLKLYFDLPYLRLESKIGFSLKM